MIRSCLICLLLICAWCLLAVPASSAPRATPAAHPGSEPISVDFEDTDIHSAISLFSKILKKNIVVHKEVQGRVNLKLRQVPAREAFELLLRSKALYAREEGNILVIYPLDHIPPGLKSALPAR